MLGYQLDIKDTQVKELVNTCLSGMQFMSVVRYIALAAAVLAYGMDPVAENVVRALIIFAISFLTHCIVYPYMGFKIVRFRSFNRPEEFVPLRPWMLPGCDFDELDPSEYETIMDETTQQERLLLRTLREENGTVRFCDFVNLMLRRLQYENHVDAYNQI